MMGTREPLKGGDEVDALSWCARRYLRFRAGTRPAVKAKFWRRARRTHKVTKGRLDAHL